MNSEKHKKDLLQQWLRGEEMVVPTAQRNSHLLSAYVKIRRPLVRRSPRLSNLSLAADRAGLLAQNCANPED